MKTNQIFQYNGNPITFYKGDNVMVNATEMAKPFGKLVGDWLRLKTTTEFTEALSADMQIPISALIQVVKGGNNEQGTWMHEDIALEFARWLSPAFAIWCNKRIKELLQYGMTATQPTLEQMINNPDLVISLATQLKNEREEKQRIETENLYLKEQNEAQRPAVIFTESVKVSSTNILIEDLAKLITQNGYKIGEIRLYNWFVDNGYLVRHKRWSNSRRKYENYYTPTQRAAEMKLFWVSERVISNPGQPQFTRFTCSVTGEGQVYFINKFNKLKVA